MYNWSYQKDEQEQREEIFKETKALLRPTTNPRNLRELQEGLNLKQNKIKITQNTRHITYDSQTAATHKEKILKEDKKKKKGHITNKKQR